MGKTNKGELCFRMPAEYVVDDGQDTAHELHVVTIQELADHILKVTQCAAALSTLFDIQEMRKLFDLPSRVRQKGASK